MMNSAVVITKNGDVADHIAREYYGREASVVDLYNDNPHLIAYGAVLRGAIKISVPRNLTDERTQNIVKVRLW